MNKLRLVCVMTLVFSSVAAKAASASYAFGAGTFAVPSGPVAIATGDFNGDGRLDLVVSDGTGISILLGEPNGSFAPHVDYPTGTTPASGGVAVGDFNGDGKLDVVVIADPGFQMFFGNGDGTLQPSVGFELSVAPTGLTVGDFNKDGNLDIAFAIGGSDKPLVAVVLSEGKGAFESEVDYATASSSSVTTADINGDGNLDLVIGGEDPYSGVSVLIGKGNGKFQKYIATPVANYGCGALAVADLNNDGKADVVCGASDYYPGGVSVLLGNGDGRFSPAVFYPIDPVGNGPNVVVIADFNGDGKKDIASANYDGTDTSVFLGNGDGTFKGAKNYPGSINPVGIVTGDFNGDGIEDIASVAGYNISAAVTILIGRGDGTFANHVNQTIPPAPYDVSAGDFNGDGKPDLVTDSFHQPGAVSTLLGNGKGGFVVDEDKNVANFPSFLVTGDFNGDAKLDVVILDSSTNGSEISTLLGNGDGTLQAPLNQTVSSIPAGEFAAADFNRDGNLDLVICFQNSTGPSVLLGKGDGTFASPVFFNAGDTCGDPGSAFAADINDDDKPDVLVTTYNGISVLLGKGNGSFSPYAAILPGYTLQGLGDFNGDGKLDLVVSGGAALAGIALGNGNGTFQPPQTVFVPAVLSLDHTVVGDFNGDGNLDLAFISESSQTLSILLGNGDGTFGERIDLPTESSPWSMAAADFKGDGGLDMAVASAIATNKGELSIFGNRPVGALYPGSLTFGSVTVKGTRTLITELYNSGGGPLSITSISTTVGYSQTNTCGLTLSVGSSCEIRVTFKPTGAGELTGKLSIKDNATTKPQVVALSGTGVK